MCDKDCFNCKKPDCEVESFTTLLDRKEYMKNYYARNREKKLLNAKKNYNAERNRESCRKYYEQRKKRVIESCCSR